MQTLGILRYVQYHVSNSAAQRCGKPDNITVQSGQQEANNKNFKIPLVYKPYPMIWINNMESTLFPHYPHEVATLGNEINISDYLSNEWMASSSAEPYFSKIKLVSIHLVFLILSDANAALHAVHYCMRSVHRRGSSQNYSSEWVLVEERTWWTRGGAVSGTSWDHCRHCESIRRESLKWKGGKDSHCV